ncbi:MAG: hypothetical protein HY525_16525 [Betaproteobacteria bacterium]|nr:hypothetical protein [Betaproteobacteria bacterium]
MSGICLRSRCVPVFAVKVFMTGPEGLGLLLSAVGVGGVLGGVLAAWGGSAVMREVRLSRLVAAQ